MRTYTHIIASLLAIGALAAYAEPTAMDTTPPAPTNTPAAQVYASFGLGCFWCGEAVFQRVEGVTAVASGYQGGHVANPTYKQVCQADTGHAEVIRVTFDPARVSYDELLDIFWQAHDPTQVNGQGHDIGPQYRSVIFTYSDEQRQQAEASKAKAQASGKFKKPIATEIVAAPEFYMAEEDHQNFYNNNRSYPYCRMIISPKLKKLGMPE